MSEQRSGQQTIADISELKVKPRGQSTAVSVADHVSGWVNVRSYGAKGDGVTDDEAAIHAAATDAAGKELVFPPGTYRVNGAAPVLIHDGTIVRFLGKNAKIDYRGTGSMFEIRNAKNIAVHDLNVDLTSAGAGAIALKIRGLWFGQLYKPRVIGGAATHTGIHVETSHAAADGWGSYLIEIHNPDLKGPGLYGIRAVQTPGDVMAVTHLNVYGGWSKDFDYGLHYRTVSGFQIRGFVADSGIDGINIDGSFDGILEPGELGPGSGYGINWGSGCQAMTLLAPSMAGVGGSLGYQNNAVFTPQTLDQGRLRMYGSRSAQDYSVELRSIFSYAESFRLLLRGGGTERAVLRWGDLAGLTIDGGGYGTSFAGSVAFARVTPVYGPTISIDATKGNEYVITAINGTAFTISSPTLANPATGQRLSIRVRNAAGVALGTVTWGTAYKMAAWTSPANGFSRAIDFQYDGTNWIEVSRTQADVPN
jgi:hypothetical protein